MSTGPQLIRSAEPRERNWLPLAIAAGAVLLAAAVVIFILERGHTRTGIAPINAQADPYAASLPITSLVMSESANLAGGKVTYLDGHIANTGGKTIASVSVQVLFRNPAHEVAQNETQPLRLIRTRTPYVDLQPLADAPLKPGDQRDFRLIFDTVNQDWDGAYPQLRILHVDAQ